MESGSRASSRAGELPVPECVLQLSLQQRLCVYSNVWPDTAAAVQGRPRSDIPTRSIVKMSHIATSSLESPLQQLCYFPNIKLKQEKEE